MASKTSLNSSSVESEGFTSEGPASEDLASEEPVSVDLNSVDPDLLLLDLEEDLPTTPEDVEALRRIRAEDRKRYTLEHIRELQLPDWLAGPPRRSTSEGWEPFTL